MIMFSCVMAIHMGLIDAALDAFCVEDRKIPVITCPKCLTYWACLIYLIIVSHNMTLSVAASFLASYIAIWLDLALGQMDVLYERIYKRVSEDAEIHNEADRESKSSDCGVSEM